MLDFKNLNIGDLLIQTIPHPINVTETIYRRGIIVNITKNISTIEWMENNENNIARSYRVSVMNSSLRKMIMDGNIKYYSVGS
jgi:hypothetical protein